MNEKKNYINGAKPDNDTVAVHSLLSNWVAEARDRASHLLLADELGKR